MQHLFQCNSPIDLLYTEFVQDHFNFACILGCQNFKCLTKINNRKFWQKTVDVAQSALAFTQDTTAVTSYNLKSNNKKHPV